MLDILPNSLKSDQSFQDEIHWKTIKSSSNTTQHLKPFG